MGHTSKKKIFVAGLGSILLVAAVVAIVVVTVKKGGDTATKKDGGVVVSVSKTVQAICAPTDYKETCKNTLAGAHSSDPKELIKLAFNMTVKNIDHALKTNETLTEAKADPEAFKVCKEVLGMAVDDLKRSAEKVGEFDPLKANDYVEDLRVWLSAVVNNHETCIDAFENTTGNAGENIRKELKTARELSSNGLAMVTNISSLLTSFDLNSLAGNRRLLEDKTREAEEYVDRRILAATRRGPDVVVAQDGSGQYKTIQEAINSVPHKNSSPFVIQVKAGIYKGQVLVPKEATQVVLIGEGPLTTRVIGDLSYGKNNIKTFYTATFGVNGEDFLAKDIAFENNAGPDGHQAVALRVTADRAVFFNVNIDGFQDSLYTHNYRQFFRDCWISGTVDFIFGDALVLFQNCKFNVRMPGKGQNCMITAQGRHEEKSVGAIIIQNGDISAEDALLKANPPVQVFLGRPWKVLSRTIIMQTNIGAFVAPEGWSPWDKNFALDTCYYGEFNNRGPGANMARRVRWKGIQHITPQIADSWTGGKVYNGDAWVKGSGVPYVPTLI